MKTTRRVRTARRYSEFDDLDYGCPVEAARGAIAAEAHEAAIEFFYDDSLYEPTPLRRSRPGDPREFVENLLRLLRRTPGLLIVIYCRVSWREKSREEGLLRQVERMRKFIEENGGVVIGVFTEAASGWKSDEDERKELVAAAEYAKSHGAVLAAEYVDRFIRNEFYDCDLRPWLGPGEDDLLGLERLTPGVLLATMISPIINPKTAAYLRAVDAQYESPNRPGRPAKNTYRSKWTDPAALDKAIRLVDEGKSLRAAEKATGVPHTTIRSARMKRNSGCTNSPVPAQRRSSEPPRNTGRDEFSTSATFVRKTPVKYGPLSPSCSPNESSSSRPQESLPLAPLESDVLPPLENVTVRKALGSRRRGSKPATPSQPIVAFDIDDDEEEIPFDDIPLGYTQQQPPPWSLLRRDREESKGIFADLPSSQPPRDVLDRERRRLRAEYDHDMKRIEARREARERASNMESWGILRLLAQCEADKADDATDCQPVPPGGTMKDFRKKSSEF